MNTNKFRYPGEFEPQDSVMLCWVSEAEAAKGYNAQQVFIEVIKNLVDEVQVYVNCGIEGSLQICKEQLAKNGVDIEKIIFTQFKDTLNWARDYGADIIVDSDGNKRLINFNFNTYGMEDENGVAALDAKKIALHHAIELGCTDIVNSKLITEGGNKEFNGNGVLMTIEETEVYKRNPSYTKEQVEEEYKQLFNLDKVIWLPHSSFDDEEVYDGILDIVDGEPVFRSLSANGHIDEMCRFVGKNTIILAEVTDEEAEELNSAKITKERLDLAFDILSKETDAEGNPFDIIRIPTPEPIYLTAVPGDEIYEIWQCYKVIENIGDTLRDGTPFPTGKIKMQPALSYCNFLILNKIVLGQKYWKEGLSEKIKEKDEQTQKVLEEVFPDRKVIMIDTIALNILGGGIHCITKNVACSN
ncbi:agmatine deiminase family protein [Bacillus toyonensis]|uniref:agmatine deiminase family protein n=1 Tax=Bacillus toyonensis TaxID=155322 RepID=UPI00259F771F|nr:agmatine deiminase family protein [Bacillus toyonensis]MDM5259321.1 agmatine deiminase family protein [Bacillus toyonensis]